MSKESLSPTLRYGLAAGAVAAAAALTYLLYAAHVPLPFGFFYAAVAVSSYYGGSRPGLLSIIASVPVAAYLFVAPRGSFVLDAEGLLRLAVFVSVALLIWFLTERGRRAGEALRRRERELTDFFENATVGLHWVGPDGTIQWANKAELEMLGYEPEEYIGRNITEFHADAEVIGDILARLTRGEELHGYESRLRCKDGSIRHVQINSNVYRVDGRFVHTRCFTRDVTERMRAEESARASESQLRTLADAIPQLAWMAEPDGHIFWYNRRWYEYTGATPDEMEGWGWQSAHDPEVLPRVVELWKSSLATGEPFEMEFPLRGADGTFRTFLTRVNPQKDAEGRVVRWFGTNTDVDALRRAQEEREGVLVREREARAEAERNEQRYRSLVAASSQLVWSADADGQNDDLPEWRAITGQTRDEAGGRGRPDAVHPEDRERVARAWDEARRTKNIYGVEYRIRNAGGDYRHVSVRGVPIVGRDGNLREWIGTVADVTERRRAEEALAAQSAALREQASVIEQAYDAIFLRDASNAITLWNRGAERMYGYTQEEARGRSPHELLKTVTPIPLPDIYESLRREGYWEGELTHTRRDGVRIVVESRWATVRDESGEVASILEITRDVTERKRAELELRRAAAIVENSDDAIITKDLDGVILSWNPGAGRLYGYTAAEAVGQPVTMLIPDDRPDEEPHILEQIRRGERVDHYETVRRRKDGTIIDVSLTVSPVRDASGRVVGASKIARDITARKHSERELREQAEIIETVNRVGQTLAGELDLHRLVQAVTDAATEISNAHFGSFFYNVLNDAGESYMLYTLSGVPRSAFAHFPMPRNTDIFAPTFKGEGTVLIPDVKLDPRYGKNSPYYGMPEGHLPVTSYLAVPVISRSGEVYGGLFFGHPEAGVFTERAARIVEGLAAQAAIAMDNARLFDAVKRERASAEASEERYRFLAESIPQIVWTAHADGRAEYFNQRWYDYTGLPRDAEGAAVAQAAVHPDDISTTLEGWRRAFETGESFDVELRLRRGSDGSYRWHLARSVPLRDSEGRVVKWFGTSTDIDDRKRAEDAQRFLSEASEVLVSSLDYEATLRRIAALVVPRLADWCAVDMLTDERTLRRLAVAHQDGAKRALAEEMERRYPPSLSDREGVAKVIRTGEPELYQNVPDELLALVASDAEHLRVLRELGLRSAMVVPLRVQGRALGAITFVSSESGRHYTESDLAFAEDLAHRAALAVENARLYREAQDVNRLKDEFLATLSHELRTPLTAVLGWTRLLGTGQLDAATQARALETIERNAQAQVQLIDDILDVSRIIRGKLRLSVRPVDLAPVIEAAVDSVRPAAEAKGIRLQVVLDRAAGPISGDPDRLQQVVWNLLSNAVKFTPRDGRVQVVLSRANSHVEVAIIDTGQGIEAEFIPYVFDRFRQADPTTTRAHGGLGLGLAIVRHLIELHGGSVRAESAGAGKGSTFLVTLPLLAALRETLPDGEAAADAADGSRADAAFSDLVCPLELDGLRVLVVEDDADSRELLLTVLEQCHAEVTVAASVAEAMSALERSLPDVVISDIEMPGEDGFSFIRRLRQLPAERGGDIPAAALTAYARPEDRMRALIAGFQIHVPKPVEPAELVTVVASLAGRAIKS